MRRPPRVYLAGPDVFLPDAIAMGMEKKKLCREYGFDGLYPFDNEITSGSPGNPIDAQIYRANVEMIQAADLGIVNLTPFRGPSADVGTVFELGLLIGLGKKVFGYTNDASNLLERVRLHDVLVYDHERECWRDSAAMSVEDFGNSDNLMIDEALADQEHLIVRNPVPTGERYRDLRGFKMCLERAAEEFGTLATSSVRWMAIGRR